MKTYTKKEIINKWNEFSKQIIDNEIKIAKESGEINELNNYFISKKENAVTDGKFEEAVKYRQLELDNIEKDKELIKKCRLLFFVNLANRKETIEEFFKLFNK